MMWYCIITRIRVLAAVLEITFRSLIAVLSGWNAEMYILIVPSVYMQRVRWILQIKRCHLGIYFSRIVYLLILFAFSEVFYYLQQPTPHCGLPPQSPSATSPPIGSFFCCSVLGQSRSANSILRPFYMMPMVRQPSDLPVLLYITPIRPHEHTQWWRAIGTAIQKCSKGHPSSTLP